MGRHLRANTTYVIATTGLPDLPTHTNSSVMRRQSPWAEAGRVGVTRDAWVVRDAARRPPCVGAAFGLPEPGPQDRWARPAHGCEARACSSTPAPDDARATPGAVPGAAVAPPPPVAPWVTVFAKAPAAPQSPSPERDARSDVARTRNR